VTALEDAAVAAERGRSARSGPVSAPGGER